MFLADTVLTPADEILLHNLQPTQSPARHEKEPQTSLAPEDVDDSTTLQQLAELTESTTKHFQPIIFTSWDNSQLPPWFEDFFVRPYVRFASHALRKPSDVVYVSHLLVLTLIGLPSLVLLFVHFTWIHAVLHWMFVVYFVGPYSIITHHHVHGPGILSDSCSWIDVLFPYILGPLMGQTWNSFYYHHKHHHIEDNGPDDLSSTIRYQRDSALDLSIYLARFVFLIWFELPLYYIRKGRTSLGLKYFFWEGASYGLVVLMTRYHWRAGLMTLIIPLIQWRIAVMTNNWAQHTLVDEVEPTSSFRSSITIIDVVANRHGLNDGYHTSHHLSPRRHWRDHPFAFAKSKAKYAENAAITLKNIDFIKLAIFLCRKDYEYLAECLVPMGEQASMSKAEIASMLRKKTAKFSEAAIEQKFRCKQPEKPSKG
jgi:hypothetical protein